MVDSSCDGVWAVSIDRGEWTAAPGSDIPLDVGDIIRALGPAAASLFWLVDLWEWQGPRDALERAGLQSLATGDRQLLGALLSTRQLALLYDPEQPIRTVDGDFRAARDAALLDVESLNGFRASGATVEIKAWNGSFSVVTREPSHVHALRSSFQQIRDEDPSLLG